MGDKNMNHAEYQEKIKSLPSAALRFIAKDAQEAASAMPDGPNAGYYQDEVCYCAQELQDRINKRVSREEEYQVQLSRIWHILKNAGYNSQDMLDDLRDLVNDSQRPATEEEEIVNSMAANFDTMKQTMAKIAEGKQNAGG